MNSHVIWLILPIKIVTDYYRLIIQSESLLKWHIWHWNHYNIYWIVIWISKNVLQTRIKCVHFLPIKSDTRHKNIDMKKTQIFNITDIKELGAFDVAHKSNSYIPHILLVQRFQVICENIPRHIFSPSLISLRRFQTFWYMNDIFDLLLLNIYPLYIRFTIVFPISYNFLTT